MSMFLSRRPPPNPGSAGDRSGRGSGRGLSFAGDGDGGTAAFSGSIMIPFSSGQELLLGFWFDLSNANVAKLNLAAVVLQANVTLQRLVLRFLQGGLVVVNDFLIVYPHPNPWPDALDIDGVPLRCRFDRIHLGG